MLTRRAFHQTLVGSALAAVLPSLALANTGGAGQDDILLNRLSFGATPQSRAALARLGPIGWLDAQLGLSDADVELEQRLSEATLHISYPAGDEPGVGAWVATDEMRPLAALHADPAELVMLLDFTRPMDFSERTRPAQEVIAASLIRAVHAKAELREVITQFWHDHFNVNALKSEGTAAFFASHDALLRRNALGNFRTLLGEVARSPSMLAYLNNEESRASPANENFARELLELHTLGAERYLNDHATEWRDVAGAIDGQAEGYIDQDVYEVARAFTGWTVGDGRWIAEGAEAPRTGRFHYVEAWHDPYQKRVLGVEFAPNRAPMADGEQVLDLLAVHPGTARLIATKLIRRLLTDDPDPKMVARVAGVYLAALDADDQIAQMIREIVMDPLFAATPPGKVRRPFEFLAALYRATGVDVWTPEASFDWQLLQAGWHQHSYGPPTGHPDVATRWTGPSTLNRLVDFALYAHDDWFGGTLTSLGEQMPAGPVSFVELAGYWTDRVIGPVSGDRMTELAAVFGIGDADEVQTLTDEDRQGLSVAVVAFAALTPRFMLR